MHDYRIKLISCSLLVGVSALACSGADVANESEALGSSQQALTGSKLATTLIAAPGWNQPANLLDSNTSTKSTHASTTASLELQLNGTYTLTGVRVAEDNAGAQNVDAFGIQCWNGTGYDAELFRETNTPVAVPGYNERAISGSSCSTSRVKVNLYNDAALEAFDVELYGTAAAARPIYVDVANGPNGSMYPTGMLQVPSGQDVNFHFDPAPGYRLAQLCTPNYDQCQTIHDTEYSLKNVTGADRIVWATFEPIPQGQQQLSVKVLASTFATPAAVVDTDVTNSKSLGNANNQASIDLQLDGYYELNKLQVFEDNGTWEVDQYGLQCWNGFGWEPELFHVNSANVVKPAANEFSIPGASCTTNRVRVNFYNNGAVEVFGLKLFGTYLNVLHTNAGIVPLGAHRGSGGAAVETQVNFDAGLPYLGMLAKQADGVWTSWLYDEASLHGWSGTTTKSSVSFVGAYARNCQTGVWTDLWATSYYPTSFPFTVSPNGRDFTFYFNDRPDVEGALMDPAYDCIDHTTRYVTVKHQGVNKVVPEAGFTRFAYVVENR